MSRETSKNLEASVHQRLLNLSREKNEDFNLVLTKYAVERLLYRLTCSTYAENFILKGAMLLAVWMEESHRPTRDLDLLGFGDAVTPEAMQIEYPTLLDFPSPQIRAYPKETVVAEKSETIVQLGMLNSRMKDFYDLHLISKMFSFEGLILVQAIRATFNRRGTTIPTEIPIVLSEESATNPDKITQWKAFLNRNSLESTTVNFTQLIDELRIFLIQPLHAAANEEKFQQNWTEGGPWQKTDEVHK